MVVFAVHVNADYRSLKLCSNDSQRPDKCLSCHDFEDNAVRLQLFGLAYNLGNFMRPLILPPKVKHWMLSALREKLIKIGAKVVHHARYITFQMAEVAIPRVMFRTMLKRVERLRLAPDTG